MLNEKYVFLYAMSSGLIALFIFLYGYVPVFSSPMNFASYQDLPMKINGLSVDPNVTYHRHVQELALIVVDSLSMDFLSGKKGLRTLPHTLQLIEDGDACLVPCNMSPPSTIMKRIKTLATGTSFAVIETILTFGVKKLKMDNIFRQANENELVLALHGAEAWTQSFPGYFHHVNTVDRLGISNSFEGAANVTGTLITEMKKSDWNWLLLHYPGLKESELHRYSGSHLLERKMQELDNVIEFAHAKLRAQVRAFQPQMDSSGGSNVGFFLPMYVDFWIGCVFLSQTNDYMILIVGNTAMRNPQRNLEKQQIPERIAPCIVIGKPCRHSRPTELMNEFDLAPNLAVLTGIPIPASSYGRLSPVLLNSLTEDQLLYALYYNTARLVNLTTQLDIKYHDDPVYQLFQNAVIQHGRYLQTSAKSYDKTQLRDIISTMYSRTADDLSNRINYLLNNTDVPIQYLAFVLIFEAMIILLNQSDKETVNRRLGFLVTSVTNLLILTWVLATGMSKRGTSFIHMTYAKGFVIADVAVIMLWNSCIMASQRSFLTRLLSTSTETLENSVEEMRTVSSQVEPSTPKNTKMNLLTTFLVLGTCFQALGMLELSYMKSMKAVWFFLWTSLCCSIIYNRFGKLYRHETPSNSHELLSKPENRDQGVISIIFSILVMHRAIMAYTEIDHWLSEKNDYICTSICLMFGLVLLALTCSIYYEPVHSSVDKMITRVLLGLICCMIYMNSAAQGKVMLPYYPKSDGGLEIALFWVTWTVIMGRGLGFCAIKTCYKGQSSAQQIISTGITCWACCAALFANSHKVLLIPVEIMFAHGIGEVFRQCNLRSLIMSHVWLGHLFFYYQGHTYSLDSVEKATEILFSKNISSLTFGVLLVMNTFSAPILSYLICIHSISDNMKTRASVGVSKANLTYGCCHLLLMSGYLLSMLLHRDNQWFWHILCPKFLYEIAYTTCITTVMITAQIIVFFHDHCLKLRSSSTNSIE